MRRPWCDARFSWPTVGIRSGTIVAKAPSNMFFLWMVIAMSMQENNF